MTDERSLDAFLAQTRSALDAGASHRRRTPDFADVVRRAHEMDPGAIPAEAREEAHELAPVVPLRSAADRDDARLDAFLTDVRAGLDRTAEQRRMRPIPQLPEHESSRSPSRPIVAWLGAALAAAAVVAITAIGAPRLLRQMRPSATAATAERVRADTADPREAVTAGGQPGTTHEPVAPEQPGSEDGPPPPSEPVPEATKDPGTNVQKRRAKRGAAPSTTESLEALDARAQALWRAGDLAGAENLFREILRRGGNTRFAELAYGDLFAIVDQRGSTPSRTRLWKNYLRRFPRGRFADDARAGLCRQRAPEDRGACWRDYLEHHPRGSYRREASLATEQP